MFANSIILCFFGTAMFVLQPTQSPSTARLRIDPTSFSGNYAFKIELKAKIVIADLQKMLIQSRSAPREEDIVFTLNSAKPHIWEIAYGDDGSPKINGSAQNAEFVFPPSPALPDDVKYTSSSVEFEGKLTLLIDGKPESIVPLRNIQMFQPGNNYVFQVKNNGEEDGAPVIGINFLQNEKVAPFLLGIRMNPDGTPGEMITSDPNIDVKSLKLKK